MSDNDRRRESTDEGELSEGSTHSAGSSSRRNRVDEKDAKERKTVHERITYNISDDESGALFAIQPKDSKHDRREKDKGVQKYRHDRHKERHDDKYRKDKREERRLDKDKYKDNHREKDRDRRDKDKKRHEGRSDSRKHKRSTSPEEDLPKKREKKTSETKDNKKYDIPLFAHTREKFNAKKIEVQEVEHSPPPEAEDNFEEAVIVTREGGVTSFTLDSPAGPKKYSKFDSSPEQEVEEDVEHSPVESEVEMVESEADEAEESIIEPSFDIENARWEDLTEEQKAMLTPETKKRLEDDWQKRLIAELPVYYPGIQGCRNVEEFKCENKIEEGTYGVVFRARDKRTEEVVALKRLKMEKEREGFPITSLREINMLLKCGNHPNIVNVREVVIGSTLDKIYLVMEFVEHDMKSLMETMRRKGKTFTVGVQKGLMMQLLSGLKHMHDLWILHRDLKTSNLLLSHKGILKIADFGLAREFGEPLKPYTSVVVTLWYRAPELLLGTKLYSTPIDMWSVGCIMGEFILQKPLFPGQSEPSQIDKIFLDLGTPTERLWPGYEELPMVKQAQLPSYPHNQLRKKFPAKIMNETGFQLLNAFLRYCPERRITAEEALDHEWFTEEPRPTPPEMFPTFPAKSEHLKPPPPGPQQKKREEPPLIVNASTARLMAELNVNPDKMRNSGFSLRF